MDGSLVHLTPQQAQDIANSFFAGKRPSGLKDNFNAYVMHGPVGAGKSTLAWSLYNDRNFVGELAFNNTVYISADEHGAMDKIPGYREAVEAAKNDPAARHELWKKFQADSQYIRSLVLKKAVSEGYSVFIDTTAAGERGETLVRSLRANDYQITLISCYAPLAVSVERVLGRERQADPAYLLSYRIGALNSFMTLAGLANKVSLWFAPTVHDAPREALTWFNATQPLANKTPAVTPPNIDALKKLIAHMQTEGTAESLAVLKDVTLVEFPHRAALRHQGKLIEAYLKRIAGRFLADPRPAPGPK